MSTYLKNMARYKYSQLKSKSYDEIQKLFDKEMKRVNTFVDMNSEVVKGSETRTEESSKRAGDELESDKSKKQKLDKHVEAKKDDQEEAKMKRNIKIVKDDEVAIDVILLATKPPVIDIDREDLETLWKLVKAKHENTRPEEDYKSMMNIKFRGGLLGLKDFKMILRVTTAQLQLLSDYYCWKDYADREGIKIDWRTRILMKIINKESKRKGLEEPSNVPSNEHQLKFSTYKCAKTLMEAIEKRFGEWKSHTLIRRNKPDLDTLSMDDLYNNLKIYETEVKESSRSNQNSQNVAFMSSNNSGSSN
ncbi:hypothetical protein Tco_0339715 [Tanacetum coccineum]